MRERDLIRTAESIADDLDAAMKRAHVRPDQITPSEWAEGFRDAVIFMAVAGLVVYVCLSQGGF